MTIVRVLPRPSDSRRELFERIAPFSEEDRVERCEEAGSFILDWVGAGPGPLRADFEREPPPFAVFSGYTVMLADLEQIGVEDGQALTLAELRESDSDLVCILSVPTTRRQAPERAGRTRAYAHDWILLRAELQRVLHDLQAALRARERPQKGQIEQCAHLHVDQAKVGRPRGQSLIGLDGARVESCRTMRGKRGQQLRLRLCTLWLC